jgi:high-affinity iron transporter
MIRFKIVLMFIFTFSFSVSFAEQEMTQNSPRFIVHLLDYLAKDYAGAVSENGKVISASEYSEQIEFAQSVVKTGHSLPELKSNVELQSKLGKLLNAIQDKAAPTVVAPMARNLQREVIGLTGIELQPIHWPSLKSGEKLYVQNCALCHGDHGSGDGPAGKGLDPSPANFADADGMKALSPFAAFNTIRLGVPGTGMISFPHLSDQELWELAFYVNSLRFKGGSGRSIPTEWSPEKKETLSAVASLNDNAIKEKIEGTEENKNQILKTLRLFAGNEDQGSFLFLAETKLNEAKGHYRSNDHEAAKTKALQAYLEGIEPIEAKLRASDPESVPEIEEKMGAVRAGIESKVSSDELDKTVAAAILKIREIRPLIEEKEMSPSIAFFSAFAIILREGFEAVLIILALLGMTRAAGSKKASAYVHGGWLSAIFLGFVAWVFSGWLMGMSGASREMMEGLTSIFAVVVLLYVGFWLHRQTEIGRWKTFLEVKVKGFLSGGKLIGLAVISFLAVFREAFETVLFLRAIWLDLGSEAKTALFTGVLSSFVLVLALSWAALAYSRKLPLKTLFNFSSLMMLVLATILSGKGIHSLQEAGVFGVGAFPIRLRYELIGLYPTVQTISAQVITALLVFSLWVYGKRPSLPQQVIAGE